MATRDSPALGAWLGCWYVDEPIIDSFLSAQK